MSRDIGCFGSRPISIFRNGGMESRGESGTIERRMILEGLPLEIECVMQIV